MQAVVRALRHNRRIYLYGCGATGRLAKQMESAIWRPFWKKLKSGGLWPKLAGLVAENIEDSLIGEMTGADRALISSLEGFEDLQLIGRLQLQEHGIGKGDAVFCISEGGETSSVIGTILAAAERYGTDVSRARQNLFFIYNNPDSLLRPFGRCRAVLDNAAISRINLATGPQAIAGSTRMQAASSETFVMGVILEEAIARLLGERLTPTQVQELGFSSASLSLAVTRLSAPAAAGGGQRRSPGPTDRPGGGDLPPPSFLHLFCRPGPDPGVHRFDRTQPDIPAAAARHGERAAAPLLDPGLDPGRQRRPGLAALSGPPLPRPRPGLFSPPF